MQAWWWLRRILMVLSAGSLLALGVARQALPHSRCEVSTHQIAQIKLEMTMAEVVAALGCDGVHEPEWNVPHFHSELVHWRGTQWPFSRFSGRFFNGVLHATEHRLVELQLSWP